MMNNKRLLLKTSSYACMHVAIAFCVAWAVSGSFTLALAISLAEPAVQVLGFAIHEKIWSKYGNVKPAEGYDLSSCCAPFDSTATHVCGIDPEKK